MPHSDALIPRKTVDAIVGHRDLAVAKFDEFFECLDGARSILAEAQEALSNACCGTEGHRSVSPRTASEVDAWRAAIAVPDLEQMCRTTRRLVDLKVWCAVFQYTDLEMLMDREAKKKFQQQLEYVPERLGREGELINAEEIARSIPPVSLESVEATLEVQRDAMPETWARGVANAFASLDPRFKSHDGFKVGTRLILTNCFGTWGGFNYGSDQRATLLDIERVFLILDGKNPRAPYAGILGKLDPITTLPLHVTGDYFRVRGYKNGNAHLWFTRDDLVKKVNGILADYYGDALGYGKDSDCREEERPEDLFSQAVSRPHPKDFAFFPTPEPLAKRVVDDEAELYSASPLRILEPSAGTGNLARHLVRAPRGEVSHSVTCVEVQPELCEELNSQGSYARVLNRNFLELEPTADFDRVVMNPPFDRGRDMEHVTHALGFVAQGGKLVAITSASARYGSSRKHEAFRKLLKQAGRVWWKDNPPGAFAECGTNVNTCVLTVDLPRGGDR